MKSGIHPAYRKVLFVDGATGDEWVSYSTMHANDTRTHKGEELPFIRLEISSASHPFWTGHAREVDTEGRMDRFRRRYNVKGGSSVGAAPPAAVQQQAPKEVVAAAAAPTPAAAKGKKAPPPKPAAAPKK